MQRALTLGEPAGIGPDLALALSNELDGVTLIGCRRTLDQRAQALGLARFDGPMIDIPCPENVRPGQLNPANAAAIIAMLKRAADGAMAGEFAAVVTAPVQKSVLCDAGFAFTGHTEFFQAHAGSERVVMLLVADKLRVALQTTHLPLRAVPDAISRAGVLSTLEVLNAGLKSRFRLDAPHILVLGLNPHAGESGHLGHEEAHEIAPAIADAVRLGISCAGPLPADTAFTPRHLAGAHAVLAMYHDQGLPVLKYAGFGRAVNVTLGLPYLRTSVDHGTALDLSGRGLADPGSLRAALELARTLA